MPVKTLSPAPRPPQPDESLGEFAKVQGQAAEVRAGLGVLPDAMQQRRGYPG
jgi:hypothetical protein